MSMLTFPTGRRFDLACLGRLAVDLYAQQVGCALEDVASFAKYLGGSSANIAFGVARLGLKSAMISRVGDEQMGRFLVQTLQREGCDTSQVQVDAERLTALVLLGIKDRDTFPLLFYRENCADMAIDAAAISEDFIADCRALLITGTHLSTPGVRAASQAALTHAQRHGVVRVLDIDYRPVLWGLTGRGAGDNRYVADERVTAQLQQMLPQFDLLIGTEEEFLIAGGVPGDLIASLRRVREVSSAAFVVKLGAQGCAFMPGAVPDRIADAQVVQGERVEVLNVLGAGDAFAAGLMKGLLDGLDFHGAARIANACGAIVVSRHACAPAMPTPAELEHWFSGARLPKVDADPLLAHLHRVTASRPAWPELNVMAFDHRSQFEAMAREAGAPLSRLPVLKSLLLRAAEQVESQHGLHGRIGVLIDGRWGADALCAATGRGWWVGRPVEQPGSRPLAFDGTRSIGTALIEWPREQVVKCLVAYHPDDEATLRVAQEERVQELWQATRASGHELLLEVIPPTTPVRPEVAVPTALRYRREGSRAQGFDTSARTGEGDAVVLRAIKRFYNLGLKPEWWKLAPMHAASWAALAALIAERDAHCRGVVLLGLNQPMERLIDGFAAAATHPIVRGFMVGRTIWGEASREWLAGTIDDAALIERVASRFGQLVLAWRTTRSNTR
jgi:5-dehydro-2-deoxygluconokinase